MATVTPGYVFTGTTDPITFSKLNLLGTPSIAAVGVNDITASMISANAVTTVKILNANVTEAKIATDAVTTAKILDANVTTAKIATGAVTTVKILDANVTAAKIATDAVTTVNILDANVTTAKILDANVTAAKIATDAVTTAKILDANVTTAKIAPNITVTGLTATGLTISAGSMMLETYNSTTPFSANISVSLASNLANTRFIECTGATNATINLTNPPASGAYLLRLIFLTGTPGGNVITYGANMQSTGTQTLTGAYKYYTITFLYNAYSMTALELSRSGPM
jgi:hypothetical protein